MAMEQGGERPDDVTDGQDAENSENWYFDLPSGAWERQEEKNRELRQRVHENIDEPPQRPDPFVRRPEPEKKSGLFGMGKRKPAPDEPRGTSGGTFRLAPGGDGSGFGDLPLNLSGTDDWSTEPELPEPLQPSRPVDAPEPIEPNAPLVVHSFEHRVPEDTATVSRWDAAFGLDDDEEGGLAAMRDWATKAAAPAHEPKAFALHGEQDAAVEREPAVIETAESPVAEVTASEVAEVTAPEEPAVELPKLGFVRRAPVEEDADATSGGDEDSRWNQMFKGAEETGNSGLAAMAEWAKKKEDPAVRDEIPEEFLKPFDWEQDPTDGAGTDAPAISPDLLKPFAWELEADADDSADAETAAVAGTEDAVAIEMGRTGEPFPSAAEDESADEPLPEPVPDVALEGSALTADVPDEPRKRGVFGRLFGRGKRHEKVPETRIAEIADIGESDWAPAEESVEASDERLANPLTAMAESGWSVAEEAPEALPVATTEADGNVPSSWGIFGADVSEAIEEDGARPAVVDVDELIDGVGREATMAEVQPEGGGHVAAWSWTPTDAVSEATTEPVADPIADGDGDDEAATGPWAWQEQVSLADDPASTSAEEAEDPGEDVAPTWSWSPTDAVPEATAETEADPIAERDGDDEPAPWAWQEQVSLADDPASASTDEAGDPGEHVAPVWSWNPTDAVSGATTEPVADPTAEGDGEDEHATGPWAWQEQVSLAADSASTSTDEAEDPGEVVAPVWNWEPAPAAAGEAVDAHSTQYAWEPDDKPSAASTDAPDANSADDDVWSPEPFDAYLTKSLLEDAAAGSLTGAADQRTVDNMADHDSDYAEDTPAGTSTDSQQPVTSFGGHDDAEDDDWSIEAEEAPEGIADIEVQQALEAFDEHNEPEDDATAFGRQTWSTPAAATQSEAAPGAAVDALEEPAPAESSTSPLDAGATRDENEDDPWATFMTARDSNDEAPFEADSERGWDDVFASTSDVDDAGGDGEGVTGPAVPATGAPAELGWDDVFASTSDVDAVDGDAETEAAMLPGAASEDPWASIAAASGYGGISPSGVALYSGTAAPDDEVAASLESQMAATDDGAEADEQQPETAPAWASVASVRETLPDDSGWQDDDKDDDVILRAFERHAAGGEEADIPESDELEDVDDTVFGSLLGDDAEELVSEPGPLDELRPFQRLQGWAPQRSAQKPAEPGELWQPGSDTTAFDAENAHDPTVPLPWRNNGDVLPPPPWSRDGDDRAEPERTSAMAGGHSRTKTLARELIETGLLAILVFLAVRASFQNFKVDGISMSPTLADGQFLIVNKLVYSEVNVEKLSAFIPFLDAGDRPERNVFHGPERGDIVVLVDPNPRMADTDLIKRIIGLPGESVEIAGGHVYINDHLLEEPYIKQEWHDDKAKIVIPADMYYVLGDNRENSLDSRSAQVGLVPKNYIIGKAMLSYWPRDKFGLAPNEEGTLSEKDGPPRLTAQRIDEAASGASR